MSLFIPTLVYDGPRVWLSLLLMCGKPLKCAAFVFAIASLGIGAVNVGLGVMAFLVVPIFGFYLALAGGVGMYLSGKLCKTVCCGDLQSDQGLAHFSELIEHQRRIHAVIDTTRVPY
jgi:hypothetical protein